MEKTTKNTKKTCPITMRAWYMPNTFYLKSKKAYVEVFTHRGDNFGRNKNQTDMLTHLLEQLLYNRYRLKKAIIYSNNQEDDQILLRYENEQITRERISEIDIKSPNQKKVWHNLMVKISNDPIVKFNQQNNEQKQNQNS